MTCFGSQNPYVGNGVQGRPKPNCPSLPPPLRPPRLQSRAPLGKTFAFLGSSGNRSGKVRVCRLVP